MKELAGIDRAIDELLVQLGGIVLRLASPEVTKHPDEQRALARSVEELAGAAGASCGAICRWRTSSPSSCSICSRDATWWTRASFG